MVAGHENSGKTSFIKTVYHTTDIENLHFNNEKTDQYFEHDLSFIPKEITGPTPIEARIEFRSGANFEKVLLRLIDTPGLIIPSTKQPLNDSSELAEAWLVKVSRFIESQYEATLLEESKVKRNPKSPDYQIHACLYFLDPSVVLANHGLTKIDLSVLKKLCSFLNVIPCLGKSDLLSSKEVAKAKRLVMQDIDAHSILVQQFLDGVESSCDDNDSDDEDEVKEIDSKSYYTNLLPFALISGEENDAAEADQPSWSLERKFPWGVANIENPLHCDWMVLKEMIFGWHMQDLKDVTRDVFYENWRTDKLMDFRGSLISASRNNNKSS